jgi:hypothetical protein
MSRQWIKFRENFDSLTPLVHAATADLGTTHPEDDLAGWAIGESGFRNRFRTFYDKVNNEFKIQVNRGTESVAIWEDCLRVRESDCMITATNGFAAEGGFYGLDMPENLARTRSFVGGEWIFPHNLNTFPIFAQAYAHTGTKLTPTRVDVSDPNVAYFYFSREETGTAIVTADAANAEIFAPFYLTLTQTDNPSVIIKTQEKMTIRFKSGDFYLAQIEGDIAEIRLDRANITAIGNITVGESESGGFSKTASSLKFDSSDFYLSTGGGGTPLVSAKDTVFKESESGGSEFRSRTLSFDSSFFYLSSDGSGNPIVSSAGGGEANTASNLGAGEGVFAQKSGVDLQFKSLIAGSNITLTPTSTDITIASQGGGGFYGIVISDGTSAFKHDTIRVNPNEFYLTLEGGEPQINLQAGTVGEANTVSNLGAGEGVFSAKVGVDLQFKSLVAGTGITLTPSSTEIEIASTGGGGGFYGVLFKESQAGGYKERDDTLVFDSNYFYLTSNNAGKPIVSFTRETSFPLKAVAFFTSELEVSVDHSFETDDVVWSVYDSNRKAIIPMDVYMGINIAEFYFAKATTGRIVLIGIAPDEGGPF